jgi:hypothetical protein
MVLDKFAPGDLDDNDAMLRHARRVWPPSDSGTPFRPSCPTDRAITPTACYGALSPSRSSPGP